MLKHLSIKNYTLISSAEINFHSGFSVITGETGAGKSILIGALGMLLGKRADTQLIKKKNTNVSLKGYLLQNTTRLLLNKSWKTIILTILMIIRAYLGVN